MNLANRTDTTTNVSREHLDQVRDFLLRQNPNHKGGLLLPQELLEAAVRGELPQSGTDAAVGIPDSQSQGATEPDESSAPKGARTPPPKRRTAKKPANALDESDVEEPSEKPRRGRPAYYPPWLKPAAQLVANGYTLRRALWRLGVSIPEAQLRQVYRWKLFREFYEEARRVFVADWGSTPGRKVEAFTRSVLGDWSALNLKDGNA